MLLALLGTLRKLDQKRSCVDLALSSLEQTGSAATTTDFSYGALECARGLDSTDPRISKLHKAIDSRLFALCKQGSPEMSPDDRGDACGVVRDLRKEAHDGPGEQEVLALRLELLEQAARGVPDSVALGYDSARSETLLGLGRGDEAVALLKAREVALPDDYTPSQLLARTLRDLGRFDEALPAVERALVKSQGLPRRAGILGLKADILLALGKREDAKVVLNEQLATYRALPAGQQQPAREALVVQKLSGLQ